MSFMPTTIDRQLALRLKQLRAEAAKEQSTILLQKSLDDAASDSKESHDAYAQQSLYLFIRNNEEDNLLPLVAHLLETTTVTLTSASRYLSFQSTSIPLFEILLQHGWDINEADERDNGQHVLDLMVTDESYVQWLLDHGAQVHYTEPEPVLDLCARVGSLATFKLLQDKGAAVSRRTLHCAAKAAAACGADPMLVQSDTLPRDLKDRVGVLKYLVEDIGTDINMSDDETDNLVDSFGHWGTPLNYAASQPRGAGIVRYLLECGADPSRGKRDGVCDAWWVVKTQGNAGVLAVLDEWRKNHGAPTRTR